MSSITKEQSSIKSSSPSQNKAPSLPRLVLRVGFAGNKDLPDNECVQLKETLERIFKIFGDALTNIAPNDRRNRDYRSFSDFFSCERPLLRLITGLCEGADTSAWKALKEIDTTSDSDNESRRFDTELAAVLPFDVETYRQCRDKSFHNEFNEQLNDCSWIQVLDGIYDKPDDSELNQLAFEIEKKNRQDLAKNRRARAYRAQSEFLLRHSDILIAAVNPNANKDKPGGTMETIRSALMFGLPVILINPGKESNNVLMIDPGNPNENLNSVLVEPAPNFEEYRAKLITLVNQLVIGLNTSTTRNKDYDTGLLREYFGIEEKTSNRIIRFLEKCGYSKLLEWSFELRKKCWRKT